MKTTPLILLVDDEKDFLNAITVGLEAHGYGVLTSETAEGALKIMEKETPDVIIADLRMTPMNGFELYQAVKKIPRLENATFFFLTGMKDSLAEKYGLTLGAEAYFVKPVDIKDLESAIRKAMANK